MPEIGVVAIAEAMQAVSGKDGVWRHEANLQRLGLNGDEPVAVDIVGCEVLRGSSHY
jgi:hypothetical protein